METRSVSSHTTDAEVVSAQASRILRSRTLEMKAMRKSWLMRSTGILFLAAAFLLHPFLLNAQTAPKTGRPILFLPGWCSSPDVHLGTDDWTPLAEQVAGFISQQSIYPNQTLHLVYYDGTSVRLWPSGNDFYTLQPTERFFSLVFFGGPSNDFSSSDNNITVAGISVLNKADEVAQVVRAITTLTQVKDVNVVAHSMGGLDARAYIQGVAVPYDNAVCTDTGGYACLNSTKTPFGHDVHKLITLDTPHSGAQIANNTGLLTLLDPITPFGKCALAPTLNRSELESTSGLVLFVLDVNAPSSGLPTDIPVTAIRSFYGFTPWGYLGDDIVSIPEQSIESLVSGKPLCHDRDNNVGTIPSSFSCSFPQLLHDLDCLQAQPTTAPTLEDELASDTFGTYSSIQLQATLDGSSWSGLNQVHYSIVGAPAHYSANGISTSGASITLTDSGCSSPCIFSSTPIPTYYNIPTGEYTLNSISGGPSTQYTITPSTTQTLYVDPATGTNNWNLVFTIAFKSTSLPTAVKPTFNPVAGTYSTTQTVSISDTTPGNIIHYAINATPTATSPVYNGPITVSSTETVEALATASGYTNSAVALATYVISNQTKPTVTSFGVSPTSAMLGTQLTATITGTAGANPLSIANLWRTTDLTGNTGWSQVASTTNVSGNSASVILHDTPSAVGTYLYGAHLGDTTGQYGVQPAAVQVVISASTPLPTVSNVSVSPLTVNSGGNTTVSIQLSAAAPSGGAVISLTSGNPTAFPLPASYLVPAGQTSISFTNRAGTVSSLTSVAITAGYNGSSRQAQVSVNPAVSLPTVAYIEVNPSNLSGGNSATVTVNLSWAAPSGGAIVSLSSSNPSAFPLPPSCTVPAGQPWVSFSSMAGRISSPTSVTLTATYNGSSQPTQVSVNPALSASFNYAQLTLGSGFNGPSGVAVDGAGNVFVADTYNNSVKEILAAGGYTTVNVLNSGFWNPAGVAVDGNGNVFVADTDNNAVKEIMAAGGYTTVNTLGNSFSSPRGVAVDGSGNVFVADSMNDAVKEIEAAGGYVTIDTLSSGSFYRPFGVAVDGSGNVFVADYGNYDVKEVMAAGGYTTVKTLAAGLFANSIAVDGAGHVFITDAPNNKVKGLPAIVGNSPAVLGSGFSFPRGVAVDSSGNVLVADSSNNRVVKLETGPVNFGHVIFGRTSPTVIFTFTFDTAGTLGSVVALTDGATGLDFATADSNQSNICLGGMGYAAGNICTIGVTFAPQAIGLRNGTVVLKDTGGSVMAAAYVSGTGDAPTGVASTPTVTVSAPSSIIAGQWPTVTVTVNPTAGNPTPTGTVTLSASGSSTDLTLRNGSVTYAIPWPLAIGNDELDASYQGDRNYYGAVGTSWVTVIDGRTAPSMTWASPSSITYGTALSSTQLNATASVPGTFAYAPAMGTVLPAGVQTLSVTFTPTDTSNYKTTTATVSLTVNKSTTAITWATPAAITYGTALGSAQLNANSGGIDGSFAYTPATGTVLNVGTQTLSVTFTPTDTTDYMTANATVSLTVNKAATTTTVSVPSSVALGSSVTLTATVSPALATGTVTFKNGSTTLGTGSLSSGTATLTLAASTANGFAAGSDSITAVYGGDSDDTGSTSSAATLTVTATTTTTVTAGPSTIALGSSSGIQSITATVAAASGTPTGTVTFKVGSVSIGAATLSSGSATLDVAPTTANGFTVGNATITASYAPASGSAFAASSGTQSLPVTAPAYSGTATLSANGSSTANLTITASSSAMKHAPRLPWTGGLMAFGAVLVGVPLARRRKRTAAALLTVLAVSAVGFMISCGGGGNSAQPVQPRTYTVTISGTGGVSSSIVVTVQ